MGLLDEAIREHLDLKRRRGADPVELERAEREALGPVRRDPFEPGADDFQPSRPSGAYDQQEELYDDERYDAERYEDESDWGDAFDEEAELPSPGATSAREVDDATRVMGSNRPGDELSLGEEPVQREQFSPEPPSGRSDVAPPEPPASPARSVPAPDSAGPAGDETVGYDIDEATAAEDSEPPLGLSEARDANPGATGAKRSASGKPGVPRSEPGAAPEDEDFEAQPGPGKEHGDDVLEKTPDFLQDTPDHDRLWFEQRPPRDFDFDG